MRRQSDTHKATCPRCGVIYNMRVSTVNKYRERGMSEWDMFVCGDCKPPWVRSNRVTMNEIWEAYCKDKGISV